MFVVSVVCCMVEVSATGRSLVQRSPTDCGVSLCVIKCNNPSTPNHSHLERGWTKKDRKYHCLHHKKLTVIYPKKVFTDTKSKS
jgi:hypothetical protein